MTSHGRHDYPNAIHLLRVQGQAGRTIFFPAEILREYPQDTLQRAPDLRCWESLVARAYDRYAAKVHGYAWLPNEAIFALQRFAVPLRIILPSLLGGFSRYLHARGRVPPGESPYRGRCESIEVTPELLPYALRNLYARPVSAGLCSSALTYSLCSARLHFAASVPPWFETWDFIARARTRGYIGRAEVERFLTKPESRHHAKLFEQFSSRTPLIAGEMSDIEDSKWLAEHPSPVLGLEQVVEVVTLLLRKASKRADGVLGAALTAWYATRTGAATLKQMGRWFDRDPTTLRADIESRRKTDAALFELGIEDLLDLTRSDVRPTAPLCDTSRTDVSELLSKRSVASIARRAEPRQVIRSPNAPMRRRGGPVHPRVCAELPSACSISKEDTSCIGTQCDAELAVIRPRRTRER